MGQESAFHSFTAQPLEAEQQPPQQQPLPDYSATSDEPADDGAPAAPPKPPFKRKLARIIAICGFWNCIGAIVVVFWSERDFVLALILLLKSGLG